MPHYKVIRYGPIVKTIKRAAQMWGPQPLKETLLRMEEVLKVPIDHQRVKAKLGDQVITKVELVNDIAVMKDWVYPTTTLSALAV